MPSKQDIVSVAAGDSPDGAYYETDSYTERAVIDGRVALVAQAWARTRAGLVEGGGALAVKVRLPSPHGVSLAAQGAVTWTDDAFASPCAGWGGEVRAMAGHGRTLLGKPAFANAEVAYREEGSCGRIRAELTAGYRPTKPWLLLVQAFHDRDFHQTETLKVQWSAIRFHKDARGIQVGVRVRADGDDPEPAALIGYWVG